MKTVRFGITLSYNIFISILYLGLLGDSLSCSIDDPYGAGRWRSEIDLKGGNSGVTSPRANSASGQTSNNNNHTHEENVARKISPPLAAVLASSRIRYDDFCRYQIYLWIIYESK